MAKGVKHVPTEETRRQVEALAQRGVPQDCICEIIDVKSEKTLRRWYKRELAKGSAIGKASLLELGFSRAKKSDTILIFLLKTRCGLRQSGPTGPENDDGSGPKTIDFRVTGRGERIAKPPTDEEE